MIDAKTDLFVGISSDGRIITERKINPNEYYSYEEFCVDLGLIYQYIIKNKLDKKIKAVYGIPNGGMILATFIANKFGWELCLPYKINNATYFSSKPSNKFQSIKTAEVFDIDEVLVVDDICDTGKTLNEIILKYKNDIQTITIHHKPQSVFEPSFYCKSTNKWVVYFWEKDYRLY